jgi:hypothetical protein
MDGQICDECAHVLQNPAPMPTWLKWTLGIVGVGAVGTGIALIARKAAAKSMPGPSPTPSPSPSPAPSPEPTPEPDLPVAPEVLTPGIHPVYIGERYTLSSGTNIAVKTIVWQPVTDQVSVDDIYYEWDSDRSKLNIEVLGPDTDETQILDIKTYADQEKTQLIASFRLMIMNPN